MFVGLLHYVSGGGFRFVHVTNKSYGIFVSFGKGF